MMWFVYFETDYDIHGFQGFSSKQEAEEFITKQNNFSDRQNKVFRVVKGFEHDLVDVRVVTRKVIGGEKN